MTMHEFTERTNYSPTVEEYHYIEESYYDLAGISEDAFYEQWLKDKESGKWDLEFRLRRKIYQQKKEYEAEMEAMEDTLHWYREQYKELMPYKNMVCGIRNIVNK